MRSMVTYGSFLDATEGLPSKVFKEIWVAVLKYGIDGIEPSGLSASAKLAFEMARPNIDANKRRRKPAIDDNCEQLQTIANKEVQSSIDVDVDVDVNEDVDGDVDVECVSRANAQGDTKTTHKPTPAPTQEPIRIPTIDAVADENAERGYGLTFESMQGFMEYNKNRGWRMNWKTALKKWAEQEEHKGKPPDKKGKKNAFTSFKEQHSYDFDSLERTILSKPLIGGQHAANDTG